MVGDYSLQFLIGDLATAVQNNVPYVLVMLNNGYLSLDPPAVEVHVRDERRG